MKNSRSHLAAIFVSLFLFAIPGFVCKPKDAAPAMVRAMASAPKGIAVVELFTSEGCSSCPPADAAVAKLLSQKKEAVFVLGFHVDYWNRLGWADPYSQAQFSDRQRAYAKALSLESIYTPQVIVNGTSEFVGSEESKLNKTVDAELAKTASADLVIQAAQKDNAIAVTYETSQSGVVVNVAVVQAKAVTEVKHGENGGRTLHHVAVVRAFRSVDANGKGSLTLDLPQGLAGQELQVIAYTQQKETGAITAAQQKNL